MSHSHQIYHHVVLWHSRPYHQSKIGGTTPHNSRRPSIPVDVAVYIFSSVFEFSHLQFSITHIIPRRQWPLEPPPNHNRHPLAPQPLSPPPKLPPPLLLSRRYIQRLYLHPHLRPPVQPPLALGHAHIQPLPRAHNIRTLYRLYRRILPRAMGIRQIRSTTRHPAG